MRPPSPAPTPTTLRPYQREAIDAVLAARRGGMRRMVVCLPTGAGQDGHLLAARAARAPPGARARASRGAARAGAREARARAGRATRVVAIEQGAQRASDDAKVLVCSIRSLHEERLAQVLAGATSVSSSTTSVTTRRPTTTCACSGSSACSTPDVDRHAARLHGDDRARRRQGARRGVRAHRLHAHAAGDDRRRLPRAAARLPDLDRRRPDAPLARRPRLRRGGARRGGRHRGAQRARRALDPGARARSAHDRVLRHRQPRAQPVALAQRHSASPPGIVHGAMPSDVRAQALADFREGRTQVLTNVAVLTEGFDDPGVSCVAMARPDALRGALRAVRRPRHAARARARRTA